MSASESEVDSEQRELRVVRVCDIDHQRPEPVGTSREVAMSAVPATSQRARVRGQPTGDQTKTKCNSSSNTKPTDANMDPSRNTSRLINETNKKQQARTTAKPKRPDEHETTPDASAQVKSQRESWDSAESLFWVSRSSVPRSKNDAPSIVIALIDLDGDLLESVCFSTFGESSSA